MTKYKILTKEQKKAEREKAVKALRRLAESSLEEGKTSTLERFSMSSVYNHLKLVILHLDEYENSEKGNKDDTDKIKRATQTLYEITKMISFK